ncbi:MAG: hypothetical protein KBH71_05445, partial [Anaerolineae bacterium]|nr:hypothetical protein [Anaerolineae bacterium]
GGQLRVLWPFPEDVAGPLVLRLDYGATSVLFAGAATTTVEEGLVRSSPELLPADVLHVPRHGAATSATPAFLQAVAPAAAVISVGGDNTRGNPAPQVLARLLDVAVYRTDQHGNVEVLSDGREFTVKTGR